MNLNPCLFQNFCVKCHFDSFAALFGTIFHLFLYWIPKKIRQDDGRT
jgi:hypothetical protein